MRQQRVRRLAVFVAAPVIVLGQRLEVNHRDAVLRVVVCRARRAVQRKAKLVQRAHRRQQLLLLAKAADTEQHIVRRQADARREHRTQVRLVLVAPKARHLAGRRHLDAEDRVGAREATKRELRHLDTNVLARQLVLGVRFDRDVHHRTRRHLDRVDAGDLAHKRERARRTHVALDHLDLVVLRNELDVAWARHVQRLGNLARRNLNPAHRLRLEVLRRQNQRRVARVHARILDVLRHIVHDQLAVLGDRIHLNLLRTLKVLGDHDRVLAVDGRSLRQVVRQVLGRVHHVHRRARQHIRRAHQHRVAKARARAVCVLEARELLPHRLVDAELVEHARELVAVFGHVDHLGRRAKHLDALAVQRQRNVVRHLPTHRDHDARILLELINVEHRLERDVFKVQAVCLVIVRRHRLRVVVHHDCLVAAAAQRADRTHRAPVELHTAADAVHTTAEHHHTMVLKCNVVLDRVVRHVQVVRLRRELGRDRVDLLHKRHNAQLLAPAAHGKLCARNALGNLAVRETELLRLAQQLHRHLRRAVLLERARGVNDAPQLGQEPAVDVARRINLVDREAVRKRIRHRKDAAVRRALELLLDVLVRHKVVAAKALKRRVHRADRLLHTLLKRAANRHHLADRLHAAAELRRHAHKLAQVPARDLGHNIVQARLKARTRLARDIVAQLVQRDVEAKLRCDKRQRVAGRLARERRRATQTRIHLDNAVLAAVGVQCVLDVALAHDAQVADHIHRGRAQHVVVLITKRLAWRHDNRVTRVHTERVKVLHVAHRNAVVAAVAHNLVLDLLPALHALFHKHLRAVCKRRVAETAQFLLVLGKATAQTAKRKGRTHNDREANSVRRRQRLIEVVRTR